MSKKSIVVAFIVLVIWEFAMYQLALGISNVETIKYQLAARYSARTSFVIIAALLLWIGISGLKRIYSDDRRRSIFLLTVSAFAINHLLHFIFIVLNYQANGLSLFSVKNTFGAIGYVMLSVAPIYLSSKERLTPSLYLQIYFLLTILIAIFSFTYLGRFSKQVAMSSPLSVYTACLGLIGVLVLLNVYRVIIERPLTQEQRR